MERSILAVVLAVTVGQAGSQQFAGTWTAELAGRTYVRLELHMTNGTLGGSISLGDIEVDSAGDVRTAAAAPQKLTPVFDVVLRDATLSFSRKDGDDTDHFEMRLVGDQSELSFLPTEGDRRELAEIGVPVPKPIRMKRVSP